MLLERYYDDSLAQASYLIGCERTREAIIVDPNRDVARYLKAAAARGMKIAYVTETHIHADFVSGSRALATVTRATLMLSDHGGKDWSYGFAAGEGARLIRHGEVITLGRIRIEVRHTPGHTPEHISFLVTDTAVGERPIGMLTGDFVFVGDVGRPDLLERAAKVAGSMEEAATQLYQSLQQLRELPDHLQLWPGHGAGSACGKSLGAMPQSTLGYERLYNPALQHKTERDFVSWVLADQPEPPPYFAVMKRLNRDDQPTSTPTADDLPQLDATAVQAAIDKDHWVVDARAAMDFAKAHIPGSINIPQAKSFPTYAGTVLSYDKPVAIVAKSRDQALAAIKQLALIGIDRIAGWATLDVLQQIQSAGGPLEHVKTIDPQALASQLERNGPRVIDVRGRSEWDEGHLAKATHIYLGELETKMADAKRDEPIVLQCESGTRSSVGASLLMARGFSNVTNLVGGIAAWKKAGLPIDK